MQYPVPISLSNETSIRPQLVKIGKILDRTNPLAFILAAFHTKKEEEVEDIFASKLQKSNVRKLRKSCTELYFIAIFSFDSNIICYWSQLNLEKCWKSIKLLKTRLASWLFSKPKTFWKWHSVKSQTFSKFSNFGSNSRMFVLPLFDSYVLFELHWNVRRLKRLSKSGWNSCCFWSFCIEFSRIFSGSTRSNVQSCSESLTLKWIFPATFFLRRTGAVIIDLCNFIKKWLLGNIWTLGRFDPGRKSSWQCLQVIRNPRVS